MSPSKEIKKEYSPIKTLVGDASRSIRIPKSIIEDTDIHNVRLSLFTYLSIYKGLNNKVCFSIPLFLEWAGYKNDSHSGGINDKVIETLIALSEWGYVIFLDDKPLTRSYCAELRFDTDLVHNMCYEESFAILYLDEITRIMQYTNNNTHDRRLNRNTVLLVFAFLRQAIFRTPNTLKPEERSPEGIAARRERCIEAYNSNYKEIALVLGLGEKTVSAAVDILTKLKLIVFAEAYRIRNADGEYRTQDIIFANMEKREGDKLLAIGKSYALPEIERKERRIQKYIPNYKIRKTIYFS